MTPEQHIELVQRLTRIESHVEGLPGRVAALEKGHTKILAWASGAGAVASIAVKYVLTGLLALIFSHGVLLPKAVALDSPQQHTELPWH